MIPHGDIIAKYRLWENNRLKKRLGRNHRLKALEDINQPIVMYRSFLKKTTTN